MNISVQTPLRERLRQATVDTILEAVSTCLSDTGLNDLTFAQVALAAGMGDRTIYRHFATKEALLAAWWAKHKEELGQPRFPETAKATISFPLRAFPSMDKQAFVIRGAVLSAQGRAMTLSHNEARQLAFLKVARDVAPDLDPKEHEELAAIIQLLQSATAWLTMRDYWSFDGERSGAAASLAIKALLNAARRGDFKKE